MKVHELIKKLQEIKDKNAEVYVHSFADIGSGWSELTSEFDVYKVDDDIHLVE